MCTSTPPTGSITPGFRTQWNRETFGECSNPNFHGHNYELELTVEGEINPDTGYVMDLNKLKELAQERLLRHLDHKNLNLDVPWFAIPDSHLRKHRAGLLARAALGRAGRADLRLRLWETPRNYVDYEGA